MSEMIERVARAIQLNDFGGDVEKAAAAWGETDPYDSYQSIYRRQARAAIEAMREPNYVMIDALAGSIGSYPEAYLAYQAMIVAALASCDGSREAGETGGLDPTDDSAVTEGQTPLPSLLEGERG